MSNRFKDWSSSLRRMFVKDHGIPVSVVEDPYFEHQMQFLDKQYNTLDKALLVDEALESFKNEDELRIYLKRTRGEVIDHVKEKVAYSKYTDKNEPEWSQRLVERKIPEKCIYKMNNVGPELISLDLVSANFQVFRMFYPDVVDGCKSYDEFISQFTELEYFKRSKKIRQIIFGNLNPKKQQRITKDMMMAIFHHLSDVDRINLHIVCLSADEIIFKHNDCFVEATIEEMRNALIGNRLTASVKTPVEVHINNFRLEPIKMRTSSAYIKRYDDGSFDLKCCPGPYTIEVLRHIYFEESHPYDKVFYNDGRLCEYKDSLF